MNEILSNDISIIIWYDAFLPIIVEYILTLLGIGDGSKRSTHSAVWHFPLGVEYVTH